jgi:hypothetical protein
MIFPSLLPGQKEILITVNELLDVLRLIIRAENSVSSRKSVGGNKKPGP